MDGTDDDLESLAAALWRDHPDGARAAILERSETFPTGTLLGRFRLDPCDAARTSGPPVDVLAGMGGDDCVPLRGRLLERAVRAALVTDDVLDEVFDEVEAHWCGPWDSPWQLLGLVGGEVDDHRTAPHEPAALGVVRLVPVGNGHPGDALIGLVAPPPVFGLWLVHEGYERDDAGRRIGEVRMHLVVLADGRWGLRQVRRFDSSARPRTDSTVAGRSISADDLARNDPTSFAAASHHALAGTIPETLARVLQVAVEPGVEPRECLLRLLAVAGADLLSRGGRFDDLARVDPSVVACATAIIDGDEGVDALERMATLVDEIAATVRGDDDWLDDAMLGRIDRHVALHVAAGTYRAITGMDDPTAAWLGSELLAGRAAEDAGPVVASLARLARHDRAAAARLAGVVEHRRGVWGVESDDTVTAVRLMLGGHVGRNAPCPCGSGRKAKHCCRR